LFAFAFEAAAFEAGAALLTVLLAIAFEAAAFTWLAALATWLAAALTWLAAFVSAALALLKAALAFLLTLAAVLFAALSPQAIPSALSASRAESAIIFFMSKGLSCLSQRLTYLFLLTTALAGGIAPKPLNFGTNDNIVIQLTIVNCEISEKPVLMDKVTGPKTTVLGP